uniref:Uncharacterized protein n=1 Tax=Anguilla anguilla TaxID=7936 RepID=A0A0E9RUJ1_ANGAN
MRPRPERQGPRRKLATTFLRI